MLIGIDGNEANVKNRVGISEYAFELLKQFYESQKSIRQLTDKSQKYNLKFQIYLKDNPKEDLPKERDGWRYKVIGPKRLWTQIALPIDLHIHKPRPDVFFTPTHYAPRFCPVPTVISIMDLSYIHYPELFKKSDLYQLKNWTSYSVKNAKKILTISEASKNDIIKVYNVSNDKVVVTYPGVKIQKLEVKNTMQNSKVLKEKYKIEGEYILFVGTLQPRKNIVRLIEAFAKIARGPATPFPPVSARSSLSAFGGSNELRAVGSPSSRVTPRSFSLIIIGKKGWLYEEILQAPKKFGIEENVKFLDFVQDEDLPLFYKHALFFILPSLYEGFGLPILEAMQYGCPVITSNVSSLPEAGGDAALYIDPESVDDIVSKMKLLISNEKLGKDMIKKGYEQVKKFSWEKTARETLKALMETAKNG